MMSNSEKRELALRFLIRNPQTPVRTLAELFDINIRTCYRIIEDVENDNKAKKEPWDTIEKEIEGLDWRYNPEREIRNYPTPKF